MIFLRDVVSRFERDDIIRHVNNRPFGGKIRCASLYIASALVEKWHFYKKKKKKEPASLLSRTYIFLNGHGYGTFQCYIRVFVTFFSSCNASALNLSAVAVI